MKNFICFLFCSFLMLFTSVGVQASISEPIPSKSTEIPINFVDMPTVQTGIVSIVPMDCFVMTATQSMFVVLDSYAMQSKSAVVPKCPFRYLYKSRYSTHYSNTAYSRLITPY